MLLISWVSVWLSPGPPNAWVTSSSHASDSVFSACWDAVRVVDVVGTVDVGSSGALAEPPPPPEPPIQTTSPITAPTVTTMATMALVIS